MTRIEKYSLMSVMTSTEQSNYVMNSCLPDNYQDYLIVTGLKFNRAKAIFLTGVFRFSATVQGPVYWININTRYFKIRYANRL